MSTTTPGTTRPNEEEMQMSRAARQPARHILGPGVDRMTEPLGDLRRRWRAEAMERGEHDVVVDLEGLDLGDDVVPVDRDQAIEQLHRESDDDQPIPWRRCA